MELTKQRIWMIVRWEINDSGAEVCKVVNAFTTKEEAVNKLKIYKMADDGLKYAVRSVYTWFPK